MTAATPESLAKELHAAIDDLSEAGFDDHLDRAHNLVDDLVEFAVPAGGQITATQAEQVMAKVEAALDATAAAYKAGTRENARELLRARVDVRKAILGLTGKTSRPCQAIQSVPAVMPEPGWAV